MCRFTAVSDTLKQGLMKRSGNFGYRYVIFTAIARSKILIFSIQDSSGQPDARASIYMSVLEQSTVHHAYVDCHKLPLHNMQEQSGCLFKRSSCRNSV